MALIFQVKVVPASGKVAWIIDKQQGLKLFIKSPPEQGKANQEVIKLIAQVLKVPHTAVHIMVGATSRLKIIKVDISLTLDQLLAKLGLDKQQSLL